ncbi:MAG: glucose-6-phosphate isomerase, partial [Candidatus Omnitrophica bacterium]|nr:glucose-6-phosphate isomerase [Candidatus Omnitrophota bacterium]
MLKKINPAETKAWKKLKAHYEVMKNKHMKDMFAEDSGRFSEFSLKFEDILVDYSKNIITRETLGLLLELADETGLKDAIKRMFSGDEINETEHRAVLHTALRNCSGKAVTAAGKNVMPEVNSVLEQMRLFSNKVNSKKWRGYTGKVITDIVNIGIGGSDLGPAMVT